MSTYEIKYKTKDPYQSIKGDTPEKASIIYCLQRKITKGIIHVRKEGKFQIATTVNKYGKKVLVAARI